MQHCHHTRASRARADCASTPRKQLGCRRCSWSGSSPGPQENVAHLQDAEVGDLTPTAVTGIWLKRERVGHPKKNERFLVFIERAPSRARTRLRSVGMTCLELALNGDEI